MPTFLLAALLGGCRTPTPLPPVDLAGAGWTVRQGQAVWTASRDQPGVAGELLIARGAEAACFVQFAKPPFTLVTAQAQAGAWQVEMPPTRRRFAGRDGAPSRFVWFALAKAVFGHPPGADWQFEERGTDGWRLTNQATGETVEGYCAP